MSGGWEWTRQRRPVWIVLLLFVAGAFAIVIWQPALIANFPREQFLDWYAVCGLLLTGLTAAITGDTTYALMFALYALAFTLLAAAVLPELIAKFGVLITLLLSVLLADTERTRNSSST